MKSMGQCKRVFEDLRESPLGDVRQPLDSGATVLALCKSRAEV